MNTDLTSAWQSPIWAGLVTFVLVTASSWTVVIGRYRSTGRPFGSKRASGWTIATILTTSAASTVLGALVPYATAGLQPQLLGGAIAMGASGLLALPLQSKGKTKQSAWHIVTSCLTVGIAILRERLQDRLILDRDDRTRSWIEQLRRLDVDDWCSVVDELFEEAKRRARSQRRHRLLFKVRSHHDAFTVAVESYQSEESSPGRYKQLREAKGAERDLLDLIYEARYDDLVARLIREYVPG